MTDTVEARLLLETVERFVREKLKPLESEVDQADGLDTPRRPVLEQEVRALGLYGYNLPASIGGPGLSLHTLSELDEAIGLLQRALPMADARDQAALEQALADARARVGA